jgi:CBS domain-containing protein
MEQIRPNDSEGKARRVKDIIKPAKSISDKVSVKAALDEMQARAIDSLPVTDERGELLGTLSKNKMIDTATPPTNLSKLRTLPMV